MMKVETKIERAVDKIREESLNRRMDVAREIGCVKGYVSVLKIDLDVKVEGDFPVNVREISEKLDMIYKKLDDINV